MGFYFRRTIKVGPVRFNLSKSGVGVSGGVRGLRVGTGPRGNYVHMGAHGLYYRSTIGGGSRPTAPSVGTSPPRRPLLSSPEIRHDGLTEIESGSVDGMIHSSSTALLEEIRTKRELIRWWPIALIAGGVGSVLLVSIAPLWVVPLAMLLVFTATVWLARRDDIRKTVVVMYEFDREAETAYQSLHDAFDAMTRSSKSWHLEAKGANLDWKRNAGAASLVRRRTISLTKQDPPGLKTNIAVPVIPVGRQRLYLFPDRVLVYDRASVGAVGYDQLSVEVARTRFIEEESVPVDAETVGTTWQYVNKKGGPDRRFKNNRQLPIMLYGQVHLTSSTGLNEALQLSSPEAAEAFVKGVAAAAAAVRPSSA